MPVTEYIWDVANDIVLTETDELGATKAVYTHEPGEFGGLVSQRRGSTTSYYHYDGLGSTRELTDSTETVTDTNMYDAWGVNVDSTGTTENPFRYVGEKGYYFDEEGKDYYVRTRTYQPIISRWISLDPLGFIDGPNKYIYAGNTSTSVTDASGMQAIGIIGGVVSANTWYGNWCGPGTRQIQSATGSLFTTPVDSLDRCCRQHDLCYRRSPGGPAPPWSAIPFLGNVRTLCCDRALCNCARRVTCWTDPDVPLWKVPICQIYKDNLIGFFC